MNRLIVGLCALALSMGTATAAFAAGPHAGAPTAQGGHHEKLTFPMKADEFQKHIDARTAKMKERMEKRLTEKNVPADKAKEIRAKFDTGLAQVQAATKAATSDGTVTEDEAKTVRAAFKTMHGGHHKKHDGDKK